MEASKIGFSNIDNTSFEGRKKKVKKEHPKREKIKENAKKMALFLAGLATLGVATVAITSKTPTEKPVKENLEETNNNKENAQPQTTEDKREKVSEKKEDKPKFNPIKALPKPKEILMLPESATATGKDKPEKEAIADSSKDEQVKEKEIILALPPHIETPDDDRYLQEISAKIKEMISAKKKKSEDFALPDIQFPTANKPMSDSEFSQLTDKHLDTFMEQYEAAEEKAHARQIEGFREQLDTTSKLLEESISALEEDGQIEAQGQEADDDETFEIKFIEIPDIDSILLDMQSGIYGKNMQNTVQYHLDENAVEIYRKMRPATIGSLPKHFIEMTISKDALGNSDKGKLKRLQGMEKKFTSEGIEKIASTEEGSQRLLRYILGIEYVSPKSLSSVSIKDKMVDMQKYSKAKKENLNWLMQTAKN